MAKLEELKAMAQASAEAEDLEDSGWVDGDDGEPDYQEMNGQSLLHIEKLTKWLDRLLNKKGELLVTERREAENVLRDALYHLDGFEDIWDEGGE